ncbi:MAG: hypothetical protein JRF30_12905 [Deltaproteobacteria bacterium]|nr:hypothetical protein [Deltaproteobacteria bacterium]
MKVRSLRIPEDLDQAIEYVSKVEKTEKTQSLRKLARLGFEHYVAKAYREGNMTLRDASDLFLAEMGVRGNIRANDVLASLNTFSPLD